MEENCKHEHFESQVNVFRLTKSEGEPDIASYTADITIRCSVCNESFEFIGLPNGVNPSNPTVSIDGKELRAPIRPINQSVKRDPYKVYN